MADIEIDLDVIDRKISSITTKVASKCTDAYNYVDSLKAELPYNIKDKNHINEKLNALRSNCNILETNFNRLEKSVIKVLNRYVNYEQELTKNAQKINPRDVKIKSKIQKNIKVKKTNTIKINSKDIYKINNSMVKDFISNTFFNQDMDIKVSNYDSGVCAAVMMKCSSLVTDMIQIDETYYFHNLNTQQVIPNNISILNDADIDNDKKNHTRTLDQILGVSSSSEYIHSVYIIQHVNDIDNKIANDSVLDDANKTFHDDYQNSINYNNNNKIIDNSKDRKNISWDNEAKNDVKFDKKKTPIQPETLNISTEKTNNMKSVQNNSEYKTLGSSTVQNINPNTINNSNKNLDIKYEEII